MPREYRKSVEIVAGYLGSLLIILGLILLVPLIYAIITGPLTGPGSMSLAFAVTSLLSLGAGGILRKLYGGRPPNATQAMLVCAAGWLVLSAFGALPFVIGIDASYIDAYFETMSGFTTTGISMFTGLDQMPGSIILWRSVTQWVGGLGILTFFLAVTARIPGAHLLFGAESHKIDSERPVPGLVHTVKVLWGIYTVFTLLIIGLLMMAGVSLFDSVNHSFTALSTGGFSPYDASVGRFVGMPGVNHVMVEYVLIFGMILGGTNFLVLYRMLTGRLSSLWSTAEMRLWWILLGGLTALVVLDHALLSTQAGGIGSIDEPSIRTSLFQTVSVITTTGFGTADLASPFFGQLARQLFLLMMVIGGCVGSTGGGIKVQRVAILLRQARQQVRRLLIPGRASNPVVMDGTILDSGEVCRVSTIFFLWMVFLMIGGTVTALLSGLDGYSSFSGMFSAMGNIGPCFITVEQMTTLSPVVKIVYIFGMLAGRLEILPVLLLFSRRAWRRW